MTVIEIKQEIIELEPIENDLIALIPKKFKQYDSDLTKNRADYEVLKAHIFQEISSVDVQQKQIYNLPKLFTKFRTYKAFMKKSICPSYDAAFDVQAEDQQSQVNADKQKALLIKNLEKMEYYETLDKYLNDRALKGEVVRFISWEKSFKTSRRKKSYLEKTIDKLKSTWTGETTDTFKLIQQLEYEGAKIVVIDPFDFVFDKTMVHDWKHCHKIIRSYKTYEEIKSNSLYSDYETLKPETQDRDELNNYQNNNSLNETKKSEENNKIELLEFWGSLTLSDDTEINDYVIVVANNKKVIRFEPNPYTFCPIARSSFLDDPSTGRGISMFNLAVPLNVTLSELYSKIVKAIKLEINKPGFAPKGLLPNKTIEYLEGKIIELQVDAATPDAKIDWVDFSGAFRAIELLPMINSEIESACGIFDNMAGITEEQNKTATEISAIVTGQEVTIGDEIKDFSRELVIKDIENIAELNASMRIEPVDIKTTKVGGTVDYTQADESVWNGNYSYKYGDSSQRASRDQKLTENLVTIKQFAEVPQLMAVIKWTELFKWVMEQLGMDNVEQFINEGGINGQADGILPLQPQLNDGVQIPQDLNVGQMPQPY